MSRQELIATSGFGMEGLVATELTRLGYGQQKVENGRVTFQGDERAVCRTNLWLRCAERVVLKVGQFEAQTFEELFEKTKALPWPDLLPEKACFPVNGKSVRSRLHSVPDCQAIVKKAIVEKMKQRYKVSWFEETGPKYTIEVAILKDVATLTIDTSGPGLHKRGYRKIAGKAPLKETMAAGMIYLSKWRAGRTLIDPFCGSGTIPVEAALIGLNKAPGLERSFEAETWPDIPEKLWQEARTEALDLLDKDSKLEIEGYDLNASAVSLARLHAQEAGVDKQIHFQQRPVADLSSKKKYGYVICNPPYGIRLEEKEPIEKLYREMIQVFNRLESWSFYILTNHQNFERLYGRKADKNRKLYNGMIECHYYQFFGPRPPRKSEVGDANKQLEG